MNFIHLEKTANKCRKGYAESSNQTKSDNVVTVRLYLLFSSGEKSLSCFGIVQMTDWRENSDSHSFLILTCPRLFPLWHTRLLSSSGKGKLDHFLDDCLCDIVHCWASRNSLGFERFGEFPGWWATTVATYCPNMPGELPKFLS